ncbi:MAG: hypothetical protein GFH27_549391n21 [Chloroflexi bacterium AL-W]|nr:hypothetical protein [Chloroflexi bacterium AL-N1]NOK71334.1 hypothetical protein [Chloroflexi bacterium AL-N10]NOK78680.1 hypothetical protein [Chloroflexi bacterium AL-N5]NOK85976.1 hypothetical protein [Chloroflexi bacterium AL-W]NOK93059.1 hypothetical protein [Chloroflexi bacterium AL-N15]
MFYLFSRLSMILIVLLVVAACGTPAADTETATDGATNDSAQQNEAVADESAEEDSDTANETESGVAGETTDTEAASETEGLTFTDRSGASITLDQPAERIVCLSIACIDYLAELELTAVGIRSDFTEPYEAYFGTLPDDVTVLGGTAPEPDIEGIAALEPDLVIGVANFHEGLREALNTIAPLYLQYPLTYQEAIDELTVVGRMTDREEQANAAADTFMQKLDEYRTVASGDPSVMILFALSDTNYFVSTDQEQSCTLFAELADCPWGMPEQGGMMSVYGYAQYSLEQIVDNDPEHIFFAGFTGESDSSTALLTQFEQNPLWGSLSAVQNEQVYPVDVWLWTGERGTRMLGIMLDEAMPIVYPDAA